MSDLDDAIREHLALKRMHGADLSEVARLEREAFGEVSRETADAVEPRDEPAFAESYESLGHPLATAEEIAPPTNEYARARARDIRDAGDATQEYSVEDQIRWFGSPAWGGAA